MRLTPLDDIGVAAWIAGAAADWTQVVSFGPPTFADHARVRFIPDPDRPGQRESDVELPADHRHDLWQARQAIHTLRRFTRRPDVCYFCAWEGFPYPGLPQAHPALLDLRHRRYVIFQGTVNDIDAWQDELGGGDLTAPPALIWPADRAWCFASDVDPHWAGIGADPAAIDALIATPGLDVIRARPDEDQPAYR